MLIAQVFSFWPEVKENATERQVLEQANCLINPQLGGLAIDATKRSCRDLIWSRFLKPR